MVKSSSVAAMLLLAGSTVVSARDPFGFGPFNFGESFLAVGQNSADSHGVPADMTKYLPGGVTETITSADDKVAIPKAGSTMPNTYVVEFADDAEQRIADAHNSKAGNKTKRSAAEIDVHEEFHAYLRRSIAEFHGESTEPAKKRGLLDSILHGHGVTDAEDKYETRYSWNKPQLFRGVSVKLNSDAYAALLARGPGVAAVSPVDYYTTGHSKPVTLSKEAVRQFTTKRMLSADPFGQNKKAKRDDAPPADTFMPHVMMGVDRLHAEGILGQDIVVGLIDTGIDYRHPALNGGKPPGVPCFGKPECQVIGGKNFISNLNSTYGEDDPLDDCNGHGVHTGGIIAARASADNTWTGVAPEAKIKAYKVIGCNDSGGSMDVIIDAMLHVAGDGVSLISMSLSSTSGWPSHPLAVVASRVVASGIPFIDSAGNLGDYGAFYGSAPPSGEKVTPVGAVGNKELPGYSIFANGISGSEVELGMLTVKPFDITGGPVPVKIVDPDPNASDEGCDPAKFAAAGPFNGTIAFIDQGSACGVGTQVQNAIANGAVGLIAFAPPNWSMLYFPPRDDLPLATMKRSDGLAVKAAIKGGANVTFDFSRQEFVGVPDDTHAGLMDDYSSISPFWDMTGGPRVSAVGGAVLSSWPLNLGEFAIESGSSMSTPAVAGIAALYMSAHKDEGKVDPLQLRDILSSTATPVKVASSDAQEAALLDTVTKQGGGLVNAYKAVHHTTEVSPGMLFLNDSAHYNLQQKVTIKNVGKAAQTYQLSQDSAGTLMSFDPSKNFWRGFPALPYTGASGTATASTNSVTLNPGETSDVQITFAPPSGVDEAQIPIWSGFIRITSTTDDELGSVNVPYFGVAADVASHETLALEPSTSGILYPVLGDASSARVYTDTTVYTLAKSADGSVDAPSAMIRQRLGSARITVDLVAADTTYKPTLAINDPKPADKQRRDLLSRKQHRRGTHSDIHAPHLRAVKRGPNSYSDVAIIGNVFTGPYSRGAHPGSRSSWQLSDTVTSDSSGSNAIPVADGEYRFLVRVLQLFREDWSDDSNYESYLSHSFTIKKAGAAAASNSTTTPP